MAQSKSCSALDGEYLRKGLISSLSKATSIMDDQYRESLQNHYYLLKSHIILTDDIIQQMANEKILPDTMIKDILGGDTRDVRNDRLLNALRLRGNKSYKRFRELMYRTGNFFVADLLWGEGDGPGFLDEKDLAKFPGLLNCVQENQKKKLMNYLDSKIREKALLLAWKHCPQDRIEALNTKAIDFNQERYFRDTISSQEQKIKELELSLQSETESSRTNLTEIASLKREMDCLKSAHRTSAETQIRFHDANIASINRFRDRLAKMKERVIVINELVRRQLELGADDSDSGKDDSDEVHIAALEGNIRKAIHKLKHTQEEAKRLQTQREDVLKLLNRRFTHEPLAVIVKDVLKHEQKHRSIVMRDILRVYDALRLAGPGPNAHSAISKGPPDPTTLDTKHFKNQLALLKAEAEHIQKRLQWKDSEITQLRHQLFGPNSCHDDQVGSPESPGSAVVSPSLSLSPYQPPNTPTVPAQLSQSQASASATKAGAKPPTHAASQPTTPGTGSGNGRVRSPNKRNMTPKTVTFQKSVQSLRQRAGHGVGGSGSGSGKEVATCKTDLDQTLVNVDQYLRERDTDENWKWEEDEKGDAAAEEGREVFHRRLGDGDSPSMSASSTTSALNASPEADKKSLQLV